MVGGGSASLRRRSGTKPIRSAATRLRVRRTPGPRKPRVETDGRGLAIPERDHKVMRHGPRRGTKRHPKAMRHGRRPGTKRHPIAHRVTAHRASRAIARRLRALPGPIRHPATALSAVVEAAVAPGRPEEEGIPEEVVEATIGRRVSFEQRKASVLPMGPVPFSGGRAVFSVLSKI